MCKRPGTNDRRCGFIHIKHPKQKDPEKQGVDEWSPRAGDGESSVAINGDENILKQTAVAAA